MPTILVPDLVYQDGAFHSNLSVAIDDSGCIEAVDAPPADGPMNRLDGYALLPGLVNAHSHAFQRGLRGRAESRSPKHPQDDFWTWRERMYALAGRLNPEDVFAVSRMAFVEMAASGITAVGEFHYLQHQRDGTPYADPDELALQVAAAAAEAGITIVLLRVVYTRAGYQRPPEARQARFYDRDPEAAMAAVERLRGRGMQVGLAPHSLRAVPRSMLSPLGRYAQERGLPLHMHVAEQPREIAECLAEHAMRPLHLLQEHGLLDERFTAVHAIHLQPDEVALLGERRATVCACPTTERNLGDGVVPAAALLQAGCGIALGTDSQCQIDLLEDARELEYHLRLTTLRRAVLAAPVLIASATEAGARSLGLDTGAIRPGAAADLIAVSLEDLSVCGTPREDLLAAIVFGASRSAIHHVWAKGRLIVCDGRHLQQEAAVRHYLDVMKRFDT